LVNGYFPHEKKKKSKNGKKRLCFRKNLSKGL